MWWPVDNQLLDHGVGGLAGERLMNRLGMPVSDDTILRLLEAAGLRARRHDGCPHRGHR